MRKSANQASLHKNTKLAREAVCLVNRITSESTGMMEDLEELGTHAVASVLVVAGLRSIVAPAIVAWTAQLRWFNLFGSAGFHGRSLGNRHFTGLLTGAIGAIAGVFGGYQARIGVVRGLHAWDIAIVIPEECSQSA